MAKKHWAHFVSTESLEHKELLPMNLKESLEFLISNGKKLEAAENGHLPVPGLSNARKFAFLHQSDGAITFEDRLRPAFRPESIDLLSFVRVAKERTLQSVWVSPERLIAHELKVANKLDEFDEATWLTLEYTPLFKALKRNAVGGRTMPQAELVRVLRTTFAQTLKDGKSGASQLLTAVRSIRFNKHEDGTSTVNKGNEAVGKSVTAAVSGVQGEIPESFTAAVTPYKHLGAASALLPIAVYVDILVEERAFNVYTLEEDIEAAEAMQLDAIVFMLKRELGDDFVVLSGNPVAECCLTDGD